jgi:death-on-curing protein
VLVALWSNGVEYPSEATDRIRSADIGAAEKATGLASGRIKRVSYWLGELEMSRSEFETLLSELDVRLDPNAQTVPKGAIRRIRAHYGLAIHEPPRETDSRSDAPIPRAEPFVWSAPGSHRECDYLTAAELLQVHEALTADFAISSDPIFPPGVKSQPLLESAAGRPGTGYGDSRKYPTVESSAAALLHSIVQNHPFHNGNKRTALVSTMVFLDRHNLIIKSTQEEFFRFMIRVAAHNLLPDGFLYDQVADREVAAIANWIIGKSRPIRREERAVTWRELQRKLKQRGCSIDVIRGDKMVIRRNVQGRRRLLGGHRTEKLETYYTNTGDGREVPKSVIKRIRQDLHLDADHGVDAEVFYGEHKDSDFFILQYSQLLKRLARV